MNNETMNNERNFSVVIARRVVFAPKQSRGVTEIASQKTLAMTEWLNSYEQ